MERNKAKHSNTRDQGTGYTASHILSVTYDFFVCYCEKEELKNDLKHMLSGIIDTQAFYQEKQPILNLFTRMKEAAENDLARWDSDIQFYFGHPDQAGKLESICGLLTGHTSIQALEEVTIEEHFKALKEMPEEKVYDMAFQFLSSYNNMLLKTVAEKETPHDLTALIRLILEMEIPDSVKLTFQDLLLNRQTHLAKLEELFMACSQFILTYQKDLDAILYGSSLPPNSLIDRNEIKGAQAMEAIRLLSDNSRYEILKILAHKRSYAAEIADLLNLTPATVSHHMSSLQAAGLVEVSKESKKLYYQLNKKNLQLYVNYFENMLIHN